MDIDIKYADKNLGVIVLDRSWYTISEATIRYPNGRYQFISAI